MTLITRYREWLHAQRGTRHAQEALLRGFANAFPEHAGTGEQRARLLAILEALQVEGVLRLPSTKSSWDATGNPRLPKFITLIRERPRRKDFATVAWVPELAVIAHHAKRDSQLEILEQLNRFLVEHRGRLSRLVPYRERALQIFGEEKSLDGIVKGDLLFGEIPLSVIGACHPEPPLAREDFAISAAPLLLVENHHTYWSLLQWNAVAQRYASIAYVAGNTFAKSARAIVDALRRSKTPCVEHFGDLDPDGLRIAASMSTELAKLGSQPLKPAKDFYRWLLQHGHRKPLKSQAAVTAGAIDWLGGDTGEQTHELFKARLWIPQESLGLDVLMNEWNSEHA